MESAKKIVPIVEVRKIKQELNAGQMLLNLVLVGHDRSTL
jgi:hypothetical protein